VDLRLRSPKRNSHETRAAAAIWLAEHPEWSQRDDVAVRFNVAAVTGGEINILELSVLTGD
jgi:Holliday junction resolvase-like predicted endonuclease